MAIAPERVACLVLAAGHSARFGADKLAALLDGQPVLQRTLAALDGFAFAVKLLACRADGPGAGNTGFVPVIITQLNAPQSVSLRCGLAALPAGRYDAVLIALGDMPLVPARHIAALLARFDPAEPDQAIASTEGTRRSPPALFAASLIPRLMALEGDQGARELLRGAITIAAAPGELADIDTWDDLNSIMTKSGQD
jgi:molybdenum cofactor cytidylyltransferase